MLKRNLAEFSCPQICGTFAGFISEKITEKLAFHNLCRKEIGRGKGNFLEGPVFWAETQAKGP